MRCVCVISFVSVIGEGSSLLLQQTDIRLVNKIIILLPKVLNFCITTVNFSINLLKA